MRKIIAAFNMTLDGYCDHTAVDADAEIHDHYTQLLKEGSVILYGRKTFELMEFWREILANPVEEVSLNEFAVVMDTIPKIVFSHTIQSTSWSSAKIAQKSLEDTVSHLKQEPSGDILVGSRSIITQLMNLGLLDELQLCIHPVVAGNGLRFFDGLTVKSKLELTSTKRFENGAMVFYFNINN